MVFAPTIFLYKFFIFLLYFLFRLVLISSPDLLFPFFPPSPDEVTHAPWVRSQDRNALLPRVYLRCQPVRETFTYVGILRLCVDRVCD